MRFFVGLFQAGKRDVRVDLRCREIDVSELFLNEAQIRVVIKHVGRTAVADFVRRDVHRKPGELQVFF